MIRRIARRLLRGGRTARTTTPPRPSAPAAAAPPILDEEEPEVEVDGEGVAAWVRGGREVVFVDIREPHEINHGHIAGAILLPMNQVPARLSEISAGRTVVVYCAAGARSFGVAHYLRENGREDAWSLVGGIGAWIEQDADAWMSPPYGARFKLTAPARLTAAAAARLGRAGAAIPRAGTIQEARKVDGILQYVLGIADPAGGVERIEGLSEADLEPISQQL